MRLPSGLYSTEAIRMECPRSMSISSPVRESQTFILPSEPPETIRLPDNVEATHRSLFDGTLQGIRFKDRPAFSFQGHPEASPGPHDLLPLFERFIAEASRSPAAST